MINFIALAIPLFFVLIGIEWWVARRQGLQVYRFDDAIVDLSCGIGQQVTHTFGFALLVLPYGWVYEHFRIADWASADPWPWVIGFFGVDLAYYFWHRWTHEMNLGWTTHVVHHQSEEYNLAVALRQSLSSTWSSWPFYLPLAWLGIPPLVLGTHIALNTLYQFWIHTETIGKLGPLEWVLNTPSHHRVHHAINPRYLDRNYAGVLIVWDRLFGTFVEESEVPVYGTVKPLHSFNPLWANVHWAWLLVADTVAARGLDRIRVWTSRPGWRPRGLPAHPHAADVTREAQQKYRPIGVHGVAPYVAVQFVPVSVVTTWIVWVGETAAPATLVGPAGWVLLSTFVWGGLFESKRWAIPLEGARLLAGAALISAALPVGWGIAAWGWTAASLGWLWARPSNPGSAYRRPLDADSSPPDGSGNRLGRGRA